MLVYVLVVFLVVEGGSLKSLTVIVHLSIFPFGFINFYFTVLPVCRLVQTCLGLLCFDGLMLLLFYNFHLSLVIFLLWALTFSDIYIATHALF